MKTSMNLLVALLKLFPCEKKRTMNLPVALLKVTPTTDTVSLSMVMVALMRFIIALSSFGTSIKEVELKMALASTIRLPDLNTISKFVLVIFSDYAVMSNNIFWNCS